ncbi:pseudouridine synthase, partial [Blyttiomyces helicus]
RTAISLGKITINGSAVDPDRILRNGDLIEHATHRHEPPVSATPVVVVSDADDLVVVDKPSSLPVHPTGRYHHNTLLHVLRSEEYGFKDLYPVNRLDRLTSGITLIARTKKKSQEMMVELSERRVQKSYLCRVRGEFPEGKIQCDEPILTVNYKLGVNMVSPNGKPCSTLFQRRSYNGLTSVVQCWPKTGRTHQIRVHLQYLGHPIANDPIYCSDVWGPEQGKGGVAEDLTTRMMEDFERHAFPHEEEESQPAPDAERQDQTPTPTTSDASDRVPNCLDCARRRADPIPEQLEIWLHSWKYEGEGWSFETPEPAFAGDGFEGDRVLPERFWRFGGKWDGVAAGVVVE